MKAAQVTAPSLRMPATSMWMLSTSAQVMISRFVGLRSASGTVLTAQSPQPASDSVSPSLSAPPLLALCLCLSLKNKQTLKKKKSWGTCVAQSVKRPTSAQVTISRSVSSSPASSSGLMARSLTPASDSVSPSLSAPPPLAHSLSVSPLLAHSLSLCLCLSVSQK